MVTITLALLWSGVALLAIGAIFSVLIRIFASPCGLEDAKRMVKLVDAAAAVMGVGWAMLMLGGIPLLIMSIFSIQ